MKEIAADVERWRARGDGEVAVATVVATRGSAPRPLGSKLAVSRQNELAGSVSGGCVESDVALQAQEVLDGGQARLVTYGISDDLAWSVGLPCGGEIDVFVERFQLEPWSPGGQVEPDTPARGLGALGRPTLNADVVAAATSETPAVVYTVVAGPDLGSKWVVRNGGIHGGPAGDAEWTQGLRDQADDLLRGGRNKLLELGDRKVFAEVYGPAPTLVIYGAVDTAESLCALTRPLGWRTVVGDARAAFLTRERIPSADELIVGWPDEVLQHVQPDYTTAIVVLTHDDKFDVPLLQAALDTEAFYIGALGARRNQERRRTRLLEEGVPEEKLERIHGPAGLDLGGGTPPETALAILAEIVATRAGRSGGSLREAKGRINANVP
jgi:xanthine dehydrogenase accessory factor